MRNKIKTILSILLIGIMFGAIPAVAAPISVSSPVIWDPKMGTIIDSNNIRVLEEIDCDDLASDEMLWILSPVGGTLSNVQLILSGSLSETNSNPSIFGKDNTYKFITSYTSDLDNLNAEVQFTGSSTQDTKLKISHGCTGEDEYIPEFPTIALPIAAVIGLVFFFQQRKRKEGK